jgi:hypothetical protein
MAVYDLWQREAFSKPLRHAIYSKFLYGRERIIAEIILPYKFLAFMRYGMDMWDNYGTKHGQPLPVVSTQPRSLLGDLVL